MPELSRITVYPIKSFDGLDLTTCTVLPNGALANDRRYALVDGWGKYISGKTCAAIHNIRAIFSEDAQQVTLTCEGQPKSMEKTFAIADEQEGLAQWCGEILGKKCRLIENHDGGFPDDCDAPGPTLISTASLEAVASWFEGLDLTEARRRFRFNLEFADTLPFWEDSLVTEEHKVSRFRLGDLVWQGRGICMRCVVPTRDSGDGSVTAHFASNFVQRREATLPDWATRARFDHFYRLGVNTRLDSDDNGNVLRVGDTIELLN